MWHNQSTKPFNPPARENATTSTKPIATRSEARFLLWPSSAAAGGEGRREEKGRECSVPGFFAANEQRPWWTFDAQHCTAQEYNLCPIINTFYPAAFHSTVLSFMWQLLWLEWTASCSERFYPVSKLPQLPRDWCNFKVGWTFHCISLRHLCSTQWDISSEFKSNFTSSLNWCSVLPTSFPEIHPVLKKCQLCTLCYFL